MNKNIINIMYWLFPEFIIIAFIFWIIINQNLFIDKTPTPIPKEKEQKTLIDFSSPPSPFSYCYKAKVLNVVDGDTVDMVVYLGYDISMVRRFRLFGINAPEMTGKDKNDGQSAKKYLQELIDGKDVVVRSVRDKLDKYGRCLGIIFVDGLKTNVNAEMLESKHAVIMEYE